MCVCGSHSTRTVLTIPRQSRCVNTKNKILKVQLAINKQHDCSSTRTCIRVPVTVPQPVPVPIPVPTTVPDHTPSSIFNELVLLRSLRFIFR